MRNNIAIVTGASSGLGVEYTKAIIDRYGPSLKELWLIARRKERLDAFAGEYPDIAIRPIALDLSEDNAYTELDRLLEQEQPNVRILVNNAGFERTGRIDTMATQDIIGMINLNVKGLTMVDRICLPHMARGAFVIHTCSASAFAPIPGQAVYAASKAYVRSLGVALHKEMRTHGVNILTMYPGNMDTEMNHRGRPRADGTIDPLPFLDMPSIARQALRRADRGMSEYTPGWFYKNYRAVSKFMPSAAMIRITGARYTY